MAVSLQCAAKGRVADRNLFAVCLTCRVFSRLNLQWWGTCAPASSGKAHFGGSSVFSGGCNVIHHLSVNLSCRKALVGG
jgi:hypothetical protein